MGQCPAKKFDTWKIILLLGLQKKDRSLQKNTPSLMRTIRANFNLKPQFAMKKMIGI